MQPNIARNRAQAGTGAGAVQTELFDHQAPAAQARLSRALSEVEYLHPEDVAETIAHIVTRPRRVALAEVVIRPTDHI